MLKRDTISIACDAPGCPAELEVQVRLEAYMDKLQIILTGAPLSFEWRVMDMEACKGTSWELRFIRFIYEGSQLLLHDGLIGKNRTGPHKTKIIASCSEAHKAAAWVASGYQAFKDKNHAITEQIKLYLTPIQMTPPAEVN